MVFGQISGNNRSHFLPVWNLASVLVFSYCDTMPWAGMARTVSFGLDFQEALRGLIAVHHSIYPLAPPQGIYFEALVERAFRRTKKPFTWIEPTGRNQPKHDLLVEDIRISLKTETGCGTDPEKILITKLCTTEKEPWAAEDLIHRVVDHLERYDLILMLRAIWQLPIIKYQLLEIPIELLRLARPNRPVSRGWEAQGAPQPRGRYIR